MSPSGQPSPTASLEAYLNRYGVPSSSTSGDNTAHRSEGEREVQKRLFQLEEQLDAHVRLSPLCEVDGNAGRGLPNRYHHSGHSNAAHHKGQQLRSQAHHGSENAHLTPAEQLRRDWEVLKQRHAAITQGFSVPHPVDRQLPIDRQQQQPFSQPTPMTLLIGQQNSQQQQPQQQHRSTAAAPLAPPFALPRPAILHANQEQPVTPPHAKQHPPHTDGYQHAPHAKQHSDGYQNALAVPPAIHPHTHAQHPYIPQRVSTSVQTEESSFRGGASAWQQQQQLINLHSQTNQQHLPLTSTGAVHAALIALVAQPPPQLLPILTTMLQQQQLDQQRQQQHSLQCAPPPLALTHTPAPLHSITPKESSLLPIKASHQPSPSLQPQQLLLSPPTPPITPEVTDMFAVPATGSRAGSGWRAAAERAASSAASSAAKLSSVEGSCSFNQDLPSSTHTTPESSCQSNQIATQNSTENAVTAPTPSNSQQAQQQLALPPLPPLLASKLASYVQREQRQQMGPTSPSSTDVSSVASSTDCTPVRESQQPSSSAASSKHTARSAGWRQSVQLLETHEGQAQPIVEGGSSEGASCL